MTFGTKTTYFHRLNGRWDWRVSVFDARKGFIFAKFVIESRGDFESQEEAMADRDSVMTSLNLPFERKEVEAKPCSFCHGSGQTMGTPYDKPEPCPCGAKP